MLQQRPDQPAWSNGLAGCGGCFVASAPSCFCTLVRLTPRMLQGGYLLLQRTFATDAGLTSAPVVAAAPPPAVPLTVRVCSSTAATAHLLNVTLTCAPITKRSSGSGGLGGAGDTPSSTPKGGALPQAPGLRPPEPPPAVPSQRAAAIGGGVPAGEAICKLRGLGGWLAARGAGAGTVVRLVFRPPRDLTLDVVCGGTGLPGSASSDIVELAFRPGDGISAGSTSDVEALPGAQAAAAPGAHFASPPEGGAVPNASPLRPPPASLAGGAPTEVRPGPLPAATPVALEASSPSPVRTHCAMAPPHPATSCYVRPCVPAPPPAQAAPPAAQAAALAAARRLPAEQATREPAPTPVQAAPSVAVGAAGAAATAATEGAEYVFVLTKDSLQRHRIDLGAPAARRMLGDSAVAAVKEGKDLQLGLWDGDARIRGARFAMHERKNRPVWRIVGLSSWLDLHRARLDDKVVLRLRLGGDGDGGFSIRLQRQRPGRSTGGSHLPAALPAAEHRTASWQLVSPVAAAADQGAAASAALRADGRRPVSVQGQIPVPPSCALMGPAAAGPAAVRSTQEGKPEPGCGPAQPAPPAPPPPQQRQHLERSQQGSEPAPEPQRMDKRRPVEEAGGAAVLDSKRLRVASVGAEANAMERVLPQGAAQERTQPSPVVPTTIAPAQGPEGPGRSPAEAASGGGSLGRASKRPAENDALPTHGSAPGRGCGDAQAPSPASASRPAPPAQEPAPVPAPAAGAAHRRGVEGEAERAVVDVPGYDERFCKILSRCEAAKGRFRATAAMVGKGGAFAHVPRDRPVAAAIVEEGTDRSWKTTIVPRKGSVRVNCLSGLGANPGDMLLFAPLGATQRSATEAAGAGEVVYEFRMRMLRGTGAAER